VFEGAVGLHYGREHRGHSRVIERLSDQAPVVATFNFYRDGTAQKCCMGAIADSSAGCWLWPAPLPSAECRLPSTDVHSEASARRPPVVEHRLTDQLVLDGPIIITKAEK
jgi:hypothetical protein